MKHKLLYHASLFIIVTTALFLGYLYYLSFYPIEVVKLNNFKVTTLEVQRGDYLTYELDFTKYRNITPTIKYFIRDGIVIQLAEGGINRPVGHSTPILQRQVPLGIPPGVYALQIELSYPLTAWRNINYSWISNEFLVK